MKYFCNPLNVEYRYQYIKQNDGTFRLSREAADPSMIEFHGKYYIFASMTLEVWESEDMVRWEQHRLPEELPLYDYAPDVRVVGDYVYYSASKRGEICNYYRTKDVVNGPYEKIEGTFDFWDPNLFVDDDGRLYFYWGCSNETPVYGIELNPSDMKPVGEKKELVYKNTKVKGYERCGEDHCKEPVEGEELEKRLDAMLKMRGMKRENVPEDVLNQGRAFLSNQPCVEGAWVTKYKGKYYLQYATPGTEYNIYADGVYIAEHPLGPYTLAKNNPYSYKPGGFIPGAGHGSTMWDLNGNLWHTASMRISRNHMFERRIGLWRAGFDEDGELFCDQRYGDWPIRVEDGKKDHMSEPEWYLLSLHGKTGCSSFLPGKESANIADENVQTWWQAENPSPGEWVSLDLGEICRVNAVQVNFADDCIIKELPDGAYVCGGFQPRHIDTQTHPIRWTLEASTDGDTWFMLEDKSEVKTGLPHDLIIREEGVDARFLRLTVLQVPFGLPACVSGLRVFGVAQGCAPKVPEFEAIRAGELDMDVIIQEDGAEGHVILWGHHPDKLYHSYMTFTCSQRIGALVKGQDYYVRVDAFNKSGITKGKTVSLG